MGVSWRLTELKCRERERERDEGKGVNTYRVKGVDRWTDGLSDQAARL